MPCELNISKTKICGGQNIIKFLFPSVHWEVKFEIGLMTIFRVKLFCQNDLKVRKYKRKVRRNKI